MENVEFKVSYILDVSNYDVHLNEDCLGKFHHYYLVECRYLVMNHTDTAMCGSFNF
jgi:hypothetical protein